MNRYYLIILLITFLGLNATHAGGDELCEPVVVYKEKIVYVDKVVEVPKEIIFKPANKNRLSLLVLNGPDNNVSTSTTPGNVTVKHKPEMAAGASFTRDVGRLTLGVFGTTQQSGGLSIGVNW